MPRAAGLPGVLPGHAPEHLLRGRAGSLDVKHLQSLFTFFVVDLGSRRVVHVGVTCHPTGAWVAQQLREATPFDERPRLLIRDNDGKYRPTFARVAAASGVTVVSPA